MGRTRACFPEAGKQSLDDDEDVIPEEMDEDNRRQIQSHNLQVVNCTTPAWPIVRKVWTGKHKEYFKMISTLFKIPLKVIRTCYLCCTGVDLDEQEREAESEPRGRENDGPVHAHRLNHMNGFEKEMKNQFLDILT